MRTNGFIFIALGVTAVTLAGTPGYLPSVGPVGLQFAPASKPAVRLLLPPVSGVQAPTPSVPPQATAPEPVALPPEAPTPGTATNAVVQEPPVSDWPVHPGSPTNEVGVLIGPMVETNNAVTPQMFLRFFTPNPNGSAREAIIVAPPGFSPARPPGPSSTATYTKPKS